MAKSTINLGTSPNDRTGDTLRDAGTKVNSNFSELYTALGNGTALGIAVSGATSGQVLKYNGTSFVPSTDLNTDAVTSVNTLTGAVVLNADNIAEAAGTPTNVYFTTSRARNALSAGTGIGYSASTGVITLSATSDNLTEGTSNLFYTSSRFNTSFGQKTTNDLAEGNVNKYFANSLARGAISATGSAISYNSTTGVISSATEVPTNRWYVDAARSDTYTATGSHTWPFKTIAAALTAIQNAITATTISPGAANPIFILVRSSITETVALTIPHVFLIGENGGIHTPIILTGAVTITAPSGTLNDNHFAITGLQIVGPNNGNAVRCTGTNPTRVFMQDLWLVASGTGTGYLQDCTGTGTVANGDTIKVSHGGTGDVYCFDIAKGAANFAGVETSGIAQVSAVRNGASLSFTQSELDANGDVVCETYGTGTLTITLSSITNAASNSNGIVINDAGGTAVLGNNLFNIPAGAGKAVTGNAAGTLVHSGNIFAYGSNTAKTSVASLALPNSFT